MPDTRSRNLKRNGAVTRFTCRAVLAAAPARLHSLTGRRFSANMSKLAFFTLLTSFLGIVPATHAELFTFGVIIMLLGLCRFLLCMGGAQVFLRRVHAQVTL